MADAGPVLQWLSWTIPGEFALAFLVTALVAWGRERLMLIFSGGALLLNAVLNMLVIPEAGIIGAAQVKIVCYIIVVTAAAVAVRGTAFTERLSNILHGRGT